MSKISRVPLKVDYSKLSVDIRDPLLHFKRVVKDIDAFIKDIPCKNDLETIYPEARRIIAFGDIHGDFQALIYCLHLAELIDRQGLWIGGDTYVVQTGDLVDDCRPKKNVPCYNAYNVDGGDELVIIQYLSDLHQQAVLHGGKVIILMGNHEFRNIINYKFKRPYIQPKTLSFYGEKRDEIFSPGGLLAMKLSCNMSVVAFIGDWVFLHGGLNYKNTTSIDDIFETNNNIKLYLQNKLSEEEEDIFMSKIDENWYINDRSSSNHNYELDNSDICINFETLRNKINKPKLKMVIGHTVHHKPNAICKLNGENSIYRVDTAMSRAFGKKRYLGDRINVLEIIGDNVQYLSYDIDGKKIRSHDFYLPNDD